MTQVARVEIHYIKQTNKHFSLLDDFCFKSKNLYNHANYLIRKEFIENRVWLHANELDKLLKANIDYPDYREMPLASSAQQILRLLEKTWKSFFASMKAYKQHPEKFSGMPKLPKFKPKDGRAVLILTNQNCKIRNNEIFFPKIFEGFKLKTKCNQKLGFQKLSEVRIIPHKQYYKVEIVYTVAVPDLLEDNERYLSIDIGVDNLATITSNIKMAPVIINGKGLKSINQYYNKQLAHYKSISSKVNNIKLLTKREQRITHKRNMRIEDFMHKASKLVIELCKQQDIHAIVIGHNKDWKRGVNLGKWFNQTFTQIPFNSFIEKVQYKAEAIGVQVFLTEESFTSGTSFLDKELPKKENYKISRRLDRGIFQADDGTLINSDVNGSLQIMKKVFPNAYENKLWDRGLVLNPVRVGSFK